MQYSEARQKCNDCPIWLEESKRDECFLYWRPGTGTKAPLDNPPKCYRERTAFLRAAKERDRLCGS